MATHSRSKTFFSQLFVYRKKHCSASLVNSSCLWTFVKLRMNKMTVKYYKILICAVKSLFYKYMSAVTANTKFGKSGLFLLFTYDSKHFVITVLFQFLYLKLKFLSFVCIRDSEKDFFSLYLLHFHQYLWSCPEFCNWLLINSTRTIRSECALPRVCPLPLKTIFRFLSLS